MTLTFLCKGFFIKSSGKLRGKLRGQKLRGQAFLIVVILQITTIKKARPLLAHNKKSQTP